MTERDVAGWLLDPARTVQELINVIGVAKGQLESGTYSAKVADMFKAATSQADQAEAKRFG